MELNKNRINERVLMKILWKKTSSFRGYTIVEMMAVLVIVGVMAGLTIPYFLSIYANAKIASNADSLSLFLRLAKQDAQRRQERVALCAGTPVDLCAADTWSEGWTLFSTKVEGNRLSLNPVSTYSTGTFEATLVPGTIFSDGQIIVDGRGLIVHDTQEVGDIVFCHPSSDEFAVVSISLTGQNLVFSEDAKPAGCG